MSGQDWIASFDSLFTNNQIQKLKILLPCLEYPLNRNLAVYIKYLELQYTIAFFQKGPESILSSLPHSLTDPGRLCDAMLPYCTTAERNRLTDLKNMFQTFAQYKEMMEMMQMMQELFPQGNGEPDLSSLFQVMSGFAAESMSGFAADSDANCADQELEEANESLRKSDQSLQETDQSLRKADQE